MEHRLHRPVPALSAAVASLVLVGAAVWAWDRAGHSTEVPVSAAVGDYRAAAVAKGAAAAPGTPAPGVYSYRASGTEQGRIGPISIDRDVPPAAWYVVTPDTGGFTAELRISGEHTEAVRYAVRGAWITAVWRRVDVTFLGVGRDDRRPLTPAVPAIPLHPRVGQRWDVAYSAWKLRTTGTVRVVRRQTLPVAGVPETAFLVESRTRTTGAHGGPRTERLWWSPRLALPVRIEADTTLGGVVGYRSRVRLDLASALPAR